MASSWALVSGGAGAAGVGFRSFFGELGVLATALLAVAELSRRRYLGGLGRVTMDDLCDDPAGGFVPVRVEGRVDLLILGPERLLHEAPGGLGHDGGVALPAVAIGLDVVAAQQGQEDAAGPDVAERELHLDRRALTGQLLEAGLDSLSRLSSGFSLTSCGRPSEEGLDVAELLLELGLVHRGPGYREFGAVLASRCHW
jgi:hypothetical protein